MLALSRHRKKSRPSRPAAQPRRFVRRLPLYLELLEDRTLLSAPVADTWIGGSGNWSDGSNWSLGQAPTTTQTALINTAAAATITISTSAPDKIQLLNLTTGSSDTLSLTGTLIVTSGASTLSGPLALGAKGGLLVADGSGVSLSANGTTTMNSASSLQVQNGGALNFAQLASFDGISSIELDNGGSLSSQGSQVGVPVAGTSGGTVNLPSAQGVEYIVNNTGSTLTGTTFNIGQTRFVDMAGGTYQGGTVFNVAANTPVLTGGGQSTSYLGGTTFNLSQGATINPDGATFGGTLSGSGAGTVELGGASIAVAAGGLTLNFPGTMFQWTGGDFDTTLGDVTNLGTMNLAGTNDKGIFNDGTLFNYGSIIQTGSGNLGLHSDNVTATTLDNEAGGSYLIESDSGIDNPFGGLVAVINAGVIKKTAGTGTSTLNVDGVLSNSGIIEADSGILDLEPNSFNQLLLSGIGFATPVSTQIYSGFSTTGGGAPFTNPVGTPITTSSVQFASSTGLNWHPFNQTAFGADITGAFGVTLPSSYTFELYSSDGSQLYIDGKLVVDDGGLHSAQLASGSTTLTAGQHTFEIQYFTNGLLPTGQDESGVDLDLPALGNPLTLSGGTWNAMNGATLKFPTGANIVTNAGNLNLGGSGATISGIAGLSTNNGSFSVTSGANFTTSGDFTNNAFLTVGAGSTFTVKGNFTQSSTGALNEQIGGTPASGQFGQVAVQNAANLAGNFALSLVNNYGPASGQSYPVVTFANVSGAFANFSGLAPFFTQSLTSTSLTLTDAAVTAADLGLTSVTAPTTATPGQQITVNWQVSNSSSNAANGNWQDSVYLSTTAAITGNSVLLGSVTHSGGLAANGSYSASLTAAAPALPLGNYYVLVQADSLYQVPVSSRTNDVLAASTGQLAVTVPALPLGTPIQGGFAAANQDQYYQVTVPAGGALNVSLTSTAASGALALYVSQGVLPTPYSYQAAGNLAGQPNQSVTLPVPFAGTYYILVHSVSGAAATAGYSLTATQTNTLSVSDFSWGYAGNGGNATIEIDGANFTSQTTASLTLGSSVINATAIDFVSSSQLFATFNLAGAAVGEYTLSVQQGSQSATAATQFQVITPEAIDGGPLNIQIGLPQFVRAGRTGTIVITYTNLSDNDLVAPLLALSSANPNIYFSTPDNPNDFVQQAQVLAVASNGPAGILGPGQSGQLTLTILTNGSGGSQNPIDESEILSGQTLNWGQFKAANQPSGVSTAAWNVIYSNLTAMLGTTTDSYNAALAQAATYLGNLGETNAQISDVNRLWSFLVSQASGEFPSPTLDSTDDAVLPTLGSLSLAIDRTFQSSIAGRYSSGIFGLGWATSVQTTLSVDSSGNVAIDLNGKGMFFVAQPNGTYLDTAGVYGTLTQTGGIYTYTDRSGTQDVFLANGLLNYQQDRNGNRITFGYNAQNQLVSLTYSNPSNPSVPSQQLTLTYNAQGFVSGVADGTGNTWTYSYDSAGHLLSVAGPGAFSTSYSYDTGSNPETANALLSITNADGSQVDYTYDPATGRLTGASQSGGANPTTYTYNGEAEITTTDAAGNKSTTWLNDQGRIARVEDPLGGVYTFSYDTNANLIAYTDAAGNTYQYSYDANGNLTQTVNPLGQVVQIGYGPLNSLTSITDPAGNIMRYSYDAAGNLLSIAYPDGTQQSFSYDPLGNPVKAVLQNGDAISYQYNSQRLISQKSFADGTSQTFTYDTHDNLLTANTYDASGNLTGTTALTYNADNELTSVTYPNGQFLKFTYNAAGKRTQSVDQSGYTLNYTYDALGRLSELIDGSGSLIVQYSYNNVGELAKKVNGNGTYTTYSYDANSNLTQEVNYADSSGKTVNSSFTYTYNALNEPTSVTDSAGNVTTYGYDALGQLTQLTLPGGTSITYVYNAAGDRTEVLTNGTPTNYSSNAGNEVTQVGSTTYTYDQNGNVRTVTDSSGTTTYTYNDLNELVSIANPDGSVQTFQYSPLGFLVGTSTTSGGTTSQTNYLVDPTGWSNVAAAYNGSGTLIAHYNFGIGLVNQTGPGGTGYYDFDAKGNTIGVTGANGTYVNQYRYLPFGETTNVSATLPNPFTFAGQFGIMQIGTNLFYMRSRDYTPATGQFLSNDPLGINGGSTNIRMYASNAPMVFADPTGQAALAFPPINWFYWNGTGWVRPFAPGIGPNSPIAIPYYNPWSFWGVSWLPFNPIPGIKPPYQPLPGAAGAAGWQVQTIAGQPLLYWNGWYWQDTMPVNNFDTVYVIQPVVQIIANPFTGQILPPRVFCKVTGLPLGKPAEKKGKPKKPPKKGGNGNGNVEIFVARSFSPKSSNAGQIACGCSDAVLTSVAAHDPNALYGPAGKGLYVLSGSLSYRLAFENDGSAPAQTVTASEQLDSNFDWSTFQFGSFGFGSVNVSVPAGLTQYQTTIAYHNTDGTSLDVKINLNFNVQTGLLTVSYTSIDPLTGQAPTGALDGFLPPDDSSGVGEGYVSYIVQPKSGLASGTPISAQASIVFDTNAAIPTQTVTNKIDSAPPISSVIALPAIESSPNFTVSWSGSQLDGPGIATYTVFVSIDGGAFTPWLVGTAQTSATYSGQVGHHYSFYSVATDQLGLTQATPTSAQATTYVLVPSSPPPAPPPVPPPAPPPAPPTLQEPPLLALLDSILGGIETLNSDGSVTVTDSFFGIPLFVSTFDSSGRLEDVMLFGFDITFLFG